MYNRKTHCRLLPALLCAATLNQTGLRAQTIPPPSVNSANNAADYSTTIAQGSLFVVFGYWMGPTILVQASLPLPSVLAGTSVTVKSGSTTLNCPMLYTSIDQLAAVLPSSTPIGTASITVSYNGETNPYGYSTTQATVVQSSFGIFTPSSAGFGPGSITGADNSLKTFANSAKPGEIVVLWGTGMGPVIGGDNFPPSNLPNFPNAQVWVGGQPAQVAYAGRSGCCAGLDQVNFTVPAVANGCNVPVMVANGGVSSNTVSLPVSGSGGACTNTGPELPAPVLTKAAAGQTVTVAAIGIGPEVATSSVSRPQAFARELSDALHTPVSEAEAAQLMAAYAAGKGKAVRTGLGKYGARWKGLNASAKAGIMAQLGQTQQGMVGYFERFSQEGTVASLGSAQLPAAGSCVVLPASYPTGLGEARGGLDAGSYLLLTGPAGAFMAKQVRLGGYQVQFGSALTGANIPQGVYTITGTGGGNVGPFTATMAVGSNLAISNKASIATIDRTKPLVVNWTGGVAGRYVLIGGRTPSLSWFPPFAPNAHFLCAEDGGKGTFTVPSYILSSMNGTASAKGVIAISPHPLSNQIAIPGIDLAYIVDGSSDSADVTFK
jgi:uncharacterized protein (TIGR03437 family)